MPKAAPYSRRPADLHACSAGDPVETVLLALEAAEKVFGVDMNSRGYKVPKSCGVIQGDGISIDMLDKILHAVMSQGYSAQVCPSNFSLLFAATLMLMLFRLDLCQSHGHAINIIGAADCVNIHADGLPYRRAVAASLLP